MKARYHPIRFYVIVFTFTWFFWICAAFNDELAMTFMLLGLCVPAFTALLFIFTSKDRILIHDLKRKLMAVGSLKPHSLLCAMLLFAFIIFLSISISLLFNQPMTQFAFTDGFSFSIHGFSALFTMLMASVSEEVGWRGYGEDAIAQSCNWYKESILFGILWALWHLPLFLITGSYQNGLAVLGPMYVINFLISVIPLGFITTWVYVINERSMLACILFHLFVNLCQEKIAMTPQTKCIETFIITLAAIVLVTCYRQLFFETKHVGQLPEI